MGFEFSFAQAVIAWQKTKGRHHLPWQKKDAYRVWVSEIMLQQTQVATVIPYFERFIQRFPSITSLAMANIDEVLHLWSGLGYYSRARNLHKSARWLKQHNNSQFPTDSQSIVALPGIGPSTAGAILSLALDQPAVVLDGNVKRVLGRYLGVVEDMRQSAVFKALWQEAEARLPSNNARVYSQGLMDLGAKICTRTQPHCQNCPLQNHCRAYQKGLIDQIPSAKQPLVKPVKTGDFLLLHHGCHVLLKQRPKRGIWAQLWSLPTPGDCVNLHWPWVEHQTWPAKRTTFTHYHLDYTVTFCRLKRFEKADAGWVWYNLEAPLSIGLPKAIQQTLEAWQRRLGAPHNQGV